MISSWSDQTEQRVGRPLVDAIARCAAPGATSSSSSAHSGQRANAAADDDEGARDGYSSEDDSSAEPQLVAASAELARVVAGDISALESAATECYYAPYLERQRRAWSSSVTIEFARDAYVHRSRRGLKPRG